MAKLKAKTRNALPADDFGMPGERKYPMPDKSHAVNAEARAKQQLNAGRLSKAEYNKIVAKARRKISGRQYADLDAYMKRQYPGDEG
jgi:hypothetical protein